MLPAPTTPGFIQIWNRALTALAVTRLIASEDEDSTQADLCRLHYSEVLRRALSQVDWYFARKRAQLVENADPVTEDPAEPDEYQYRYNLPDDLVRPLQLMQGLRVERKDQRIPFRLESYNGKVVLLTDQSPAYLRYTFWADDSGFYPSAFRDYLSLKLAEALAVPLSAEPALIRLALEKAEVAFQEAVAVNFSSEEEPDEPMSEYEAVRGATLHSDEAFLRARGT